MLSKKGLLGGELLACLDWLSDTGKAKGQQDPQLTATLAPTRVQNVQTQGRK